MLSHRQHQPVRIALLAATALAAAMAFTVMSASVANADTFVESGTRDTEAVIGGGTSVSPDGCRSTEASFQATRLFEGTPDVSYSASITDFCAGTFTVVGGATSDAVIEFAPSALQSARVVATVPLRDFFTGQPAGDVRIDNTFAGFGSVTAAHGKFETRFERTMLKIVSNGQAREATSVGSLPVDFALLNDGVSHTLFLIHDPPF